MAYQKQNFQSGQVLTAQKLNLMDEQIAANSITGEIADALIVHIDASKYNLANGYCQLSGVKDEASSPLRYNERKLQLKTGDTFVVEYEAPETNTSIAAIKAYDIINGQIANVMFSPAKKRYVYVATISEASVRFTINSTKPYKMYVIHNPDVAVNIKSYSTKDFDKAGYVTNTGKLETASPGNYTYEEIPLTCGDTVRVFANAAITGVSYITVVGVGRYIPVAVGVSGQKIYNYTATKNVTVIVCGVKSFYSSWIVVKSDNRTNIEGLNGRMDAVEDAVNFLPMFHKIGVIGDSLSSGELGLTLEDGSHDFIDIYDNSWLSNLARVNGFEKVHYSNGGLTCKTWLDRRSSEIAAESVKCDAYFLALGTNDSLNVPYPMGTPTDEAGTNTFCGLYKQIIELVKREAPHAYIFCMSLYNRNNIAYSNAICDMVEQYGRVFYIPFCEESNLLQSASYDDAYQSYGHFSSIGYTKVADNISKITNRVIHENRQWFKYFGYND